MLFEKAVSFCICNRHVLVVVPKSLFTECILRVVGLSRCSDLVEQHCQYKSHVGQQIYVFNMKNSKLKDVGEINLNFPNVQI